MSSINPIDIIPILRVWLGKNEKYPLVRWLDSVEASSADLTIDFSDAADVKAAAECLKKYDLNKLKNPAKIWLKPFGVVEVVDDTASLVGRVAGKAALVTGAAQGFGLEIAQHLAAQGARVCLADINDAGAATAAAELAKKYGERRAMAVKMNVTDLSSIRQGLEAAVKAFGGLDIFIANAGVLKAGSVKTQSEKDFDFVTSVNYKGFFLCTQAAAPILAAGHLVKSDYLSDIIQINSKSGLQGSNKNGAYAGSKFGSIGLVQSFAMELIEDGIKVNAICPGNFFDGPLWSDPNNGLFVQYLRTGKVPGAKTIDDVRRAYEQKVPMGRGCRTEDVMKAIYYIVEQQYETGQALPVAGGQVMMH